MKKEKDTDYEEYENISLSNNLCPYLYLNLNTRIAYILNGNYL